VDLWAQIVIPLVALAGGWFGNTWRYRRNRLDRLAELRQKAVELEVYKRREQAEDDRGRELSDRYWIEKAAELCRSSDPQDREHGRGFLVGLAAMGNTNPRVVELLDQVTQLELGHTVAEIREAKQHEDLTIDIVEEVLVSDDAGNVTDHRSGSAHGREEDGGQVEAQEEREEDQGDPEPGRRCPGEAGN
jgi:hypothetical protein